MIYSMLLGFVVVVVVVVVVVFVGVLGYSPAEG